MPESEMATLCRSLAQTMQEKGGDIRTFMPRWGCINERRNQLHEVIRLSGMNLIINDNDHQLIIKVASIPSARMQIYFIDNEDYFSRKATLAGADGTEFPDNDERALFFARGVLETVKKLRWTPDIVHCHGWFSGVVPAYLRNAMADDPIFKDAKIVVSIHDDAFQGTLDPKLAGKLEEEGVKKEDTEILSSPTYQNMMQFVIDYADAVAVDTATPDAGVTDYLKGTGKPVLDYAPRESAVEMDKYKLFYDDLLKA